MKRSEESKKEIYSYYIEHGIHKTVEKFSLSKTQIRRICRYVVETYNLPKRDNSDSYRKYTLNKDFFEKIDSEEKAYWLGFIAADGAINQKQRRLDVSLNQSDKNHLAKLAKSLKSNRPIEEFKRYDKRYDSYFDVARVSFNSKKLIDDLSKHNIVANKTTSYTPNMIFDKQLSRHFWRGLCDGDGSLKHNKYKNGSITKVIEIYGTEQTCLEFNKFLEEHFNTKFNLIKHRSIYRVSCQRNKLSREIAKLLYDKSVVALLRKENIARSWYKQQGQP